MMITIDDISFRVHVSWEEAKKLLYRYIKEEEGGNKVPYTNKIIPYLVKKYFLVLICYSQRRELFTNIYLITYEKTKNSQIQQWYQLVTLDKLVRLEIPRENIKEAWIFAILKWKLNEWKLDLQNQLFKKFQEKFQCFIKNKKDNKHRLTTVSRWQKMSKYSIVHRKYVANATKNDKNKKEMEVMIQQKQDTIISSNGAAPKNSTPHKHNANKLNNFYANKIFGNKANNIHETIKKERSKSSSRSSSGSTWKVSKWKSKDKINNLDSTNDGDKTVDDPNDYVQKKI